MFGDRFSSSTSCSRGVHETEPDRPDQSLTCCFLKVATHPLAFIIEDTPHLTIFERKGDQFEYLKELVMPFRPGLVAEAPGGIADARRLDILDRSLHEVVSITSEFPDYLETGADPVSTNSRTLMVASRTGGGGSVKFRVFEYPERITLAIETPDDLRFVGSFSTTDQVPLVIVGDYHGTGSRQVIYVP